MHPRRVRRICQALCTSQLNASCTRTRMQCNTIRDHQSIQNRMTSACIRRMVVTKSKLKVLGATACMVIRRRANRYGNFAEVEHYSNNDPTCYTYDHVRSTHWKDGNSKNGVNRTRTDFTRACTVIGWIDYGIEKGGPTVKRCTGWTYTGACQHICHHPPATSTRWEDAW